MKRYIVGLGEALWDVLPEGKKLGGAPANFAYHAAQFGLQTIAISALGEDSLAEETIEALKEHNLNYLMPRVPYPTGTVQVTLSGEGIPTYDIKENVAWDNIPFNSEMEEIAKNARAVCFGSLAQRNVVSRENIRKFLDATPDDCLKICDINLRQQFYSKEILEDYVRLRWSRYASDLREDCSGLSPEDARADMRHQRIVCVYRRRADLIPGHAEGRGSRYRRSR